MDKKWGFHRTIITFLVAALAIVAIGILVFIFAFRAQDLTAQDFQNVAQGIAIFLAVFTGTMAAAIGARSHSLKEVDKTNERFDNAVRSMCLEDKEGENNIYIRIQGVYALERLAFSGISKKERQRVVDILCTRFREKCPAKDENGDWHDYTRRKNDHDVIIDSIARITQKYKGNDVDLYGTNLVGADLRGADLRGARLMFANLRGVNLRGANLREANLNYAAISKYAMLDWEDEYLKAKYDVEKSLNQGRIMPEEKTTCSNTSKTSISF
jgi:uncharacterized protein YjbI with pentapeptide repeats